MNTMIDTNGNAGFVVEDLRSVKDAIADFRLTRKIPNHGAYSLLFQLNDDGSTLALTGIEKEGGEKERHNKLFDFKIPDLTIPETVEGYVVSTISSFVFRNSGSWLDIGRLTIPNTIRHIRGNAFGRGKIQELLIPASVCEIQPLAQNSMIYSIKIDKGNKRYDSRNDCNAIIDTANNKLILGCINSTIPDTVTKIGEEAFFMCGCGELMEIVIPQSVLIIGERAFSFCSGLEKAVIASSIIGKSAFSECVRLKEVLLYDFVTQIGESAFSGCVSLKEVVIPNSTTTIGAFAFQGCSGLERIIIPDSVTFIGEGAFLGCDNVQISISNQSLLKKAKELPYKERLRHKETEENYLKDSEFLRYKLYHHLQLYYWGLVDQIDITMPQSFNMALLQSLNHRWLFELKGFVKYIHFYGISQDDSFAGIDLYIDLNSSKITDDKTELCIDGRNAVFDSESLVSDLIFGDQIQVDSSEVQNIEVIEYSTSPESTILNPDYHAIITSNKDKDNGAYYEASSFLKNNWILTESFFDGHSNIFHRLDAYSDVISNYYFLAGFGIDKRDLDGYMLLFANIGVDGSKVNAECVKVFLSEFKAYLDAIANLIAKSLQDHRRWQQAVEGAVSKVMSRNSEHNHGSHVLAHLGDNNIYQRMCDEELSKSLKSFISDNCVYFKDKNLQLPYFFQYLRNRGSYQSEVVFGVSNTLTSRKVFGDVMKDFDQVRVLLNYISGVSDFSYRFNLLLNGQEMDSNNDIAVAMPGDVIGCQAFYLIIENIIRNTAKHAKKELGCATTFTISFSTIEVHPDYYCVEIDNGIKEVDIVELVKKQNELINESILDKSFNLRNYGLGLIEMETSAAFLRQIPIAKIDSYEYRFKENDDLTNERHNLIILKAINKNGALGYRFFLQKPKEILFIGDCPLDSSKKDMMNKEGVQFISEEGFTKVIHEGLPFSHPFLLYSEELKNETKKLLSDDSNCKTLLPIRKVMVSRDEINEVVDNVNTRGSILSLLKDLAWKKHMQSMGIEAGAIHIGENVSRRYSNCRQVVFANHGTKTKHETYWSDRNREQLPELWVDNLSSCTQNKLPLFAQYSQGRDCVTEELLTRYLDSITQQLQLQLEIFEAYHNKVVVLDERIQRFALENFEGSSDKEEGGPIPISALFKSTNVIIPVTKLDPERFDEASIKEIEKFICDECAETNKAFLLLHYGILERMYKIEQVITEKLETWAKKAKRVVVTSGRGSHSLQLPDSVCFVNLSSVLNAFTENRNKYLINCLINQSRRKNE